MQKPMICECCGGTLKAEGTLGIWKCEYCGTQYEDRFGSVMRIETYQNPVVMLESKIRVDKYAALSNPSKVSEWSLEALSQNLAKELIKYADIKTEQEFDPLLDQINIRARVRVVAPKYKF